MNDEIEDIEVEDTAELGVEGTELENFEAASIEGYYALLAMVMNVARTPLPAGAKPPLAAFPR